MKNTLLSFLFLFFLNTYLFAQTDTVNISMVKPADGMDLYMPALDKYILKAKATKTDSNSIFTDTYFMIGSDKIFAYEYGEYFIGEWTPTVSGNYNVSFTAKTSADGEATSDVDFELKQNALDMTVVAFEDALVKFGGTGRTVYRSAVLPNHLGAFNSVVAELDVVCPTGDCDIWDRKAWIEAKGPDGNWIELIRYMTPYGRSCNHTIDLTDYLFMLEGNVEFRIFTDTWAGSWEYNLTLNYFAGEPEYKYGNAVSVYSGNYALGDYANLQPFEEVTFNFDDNIEKAQLNMLLSGHGWGNNNSNNAAEFYNITNQLYLNGDVINQNPWNDCNPNPDACVNSPQSTWYHDRAGWCPGAITHPFKYDLSGYITDVEMNIHYKYQEDYVDLCHNNHPNVANVTGCDPNSGENPYYVFGTAFLTYSNNEPMESKSRPITLAVDNVDNFNFELFPNPAKNQLTITLSNQNQPFILIHNSLGQKMKRVSTASILKSNNKVVIDLSNFDNGIYFVDLYNGKNSSTKKFIVQK
ncbi:MAG: T9SS type A sorting domain-containing protein [Chitinophagales bacterium]